MSVINKIVHPNYDESVVENDLALLILENDSIHPYVTINTDDTVPIDGDKLVVMGWGDIDSSEYGQETSDKLRETDVWYLTNSKCEESEGYVKTEEGVLFGSYEGSIQESMLCAHDFIGTTSDACQGDSGKIFIYYMSTCICREFFVCTKLNSFVFCLVLSYFYYFSLAYFSSLPVVKYRWCTCKNWIRLHR